MELQVPLNSTHVDPTAWFGRRKVYNIKCCYCENHLCNRGMRAMLLSDLDTKLYSTDISPKPNTDFVGKVYAMASCLCKVKDFACITCGNIVGYNVILPCQRCLESLNNGHSWIFYNATVEANKRFNRKGTWLLTWN